MIRHPNLILYLPFDGSFADASKSANPITVTGATLTPGRQGQCGNFDGSDDYLRTGNNLGLSGTEDWTISFWIYRDGHADYSIIFWPATIGNTGLCLLLVWGNPLTTQFWIWVGPGTEAEAKGFLNNVWYHFVITSKNRRAIIFVNGQQVTLSRNNDLPSLTNAITNICSQGDPYQGNAKLKGKLDELCVFKGLAVSQSDAKRLMMGLAPIERR